MVYTFDLKDKVVLVTGGYGHLGKAITESLVYHNAIVYVLGRDKGKFDEAFQRNTNLYFANCDIADSESIEQSIEKIFCKEKNILYFSSKSCTL